MRKLLIFFTLLFLVTALQFSTTKIYSAVNFDIQINEIMPDPSGDDALYEWIEIKNPSSSVIQTNKYRINNIQLPLFSINPGQFVILAKNPSFIQSKFPDLAVEVKQFSLTLGNTGGTLILTDNTNLTVQSFVYPQATTDKSFELLTGGCERIQVNQNGNSIGLENTSCYIPTSTYSQTPTPSIGVSKYTNLLEITQINPCSNFDSIIIRNNDSYLIDLSKWRIETNKGFSLYLTDMQINPKSDISIIAEQNAFSDSGDSIFLIDPSGSQKDVFTYNACTNSGDFFEILSSSILNSGTTPTVNVSTLELKIPQVYYY